MTPYRLGNVCEFASYPIPKEFVSSIPEWTQSLQRYRANDTARLPVTGNIIIMIIIVLWSAFTRSTVGPGGRRIPFVADDGTLQKRRVRGFFFMQIPSDFISSSNPIVVFFNDRLNSVQDLFRYGRKWPCENWDRRNCRRCRHDISLRFFLFSSFCVDSSEFITRFQYTPGFRGTAESNKKLTLLPAVFSRMKFWITSI